MIELSFEYSYVRLAAKWLSLCLRTKWLWVRVLLLSLNLRILIQATTECGFTPETHIWHAKNIHQMHRTDKYSQYSLIVWPVWRNGWVFVCELSGCGLHYRCSHLKKTLSPLFMDGIQLPLGYYHSEEAVYFLLLSSQKSLVLILSTSGEWNWLDLGATQWFWTRGHWICESSAKKFRYFFKSCSKLLQSIFKTSPFKLQMSR